MWRLRQYQVQDFISYAQPLQGGFALNHHYISWSCKAMDSRVQDYLDDKLQSSADLETLDSLLANVKNQQDLLKKQVGTNTTRT